MEPTRHTSRDGHGWWAVALLILAMGVVGGSLAQHRTPAVLPLDAPPETFSAMRAFEHTRVIAQAPHPAGSTANAAVAEYIASQIRALGLKPEYQDAALHGAPGQAATVHNVLTRIAGTGATRRAVLLMTHYDSVPWGPGAADDGAGVVVLLEAMRALLAGPKCTHDIIFLFTDGEEGRGEKDSGCRGAGAFVTQHPWLADVAVVVNFDARGNGGPAYMYETPEENGWLIARLQESDCRPVATSFMYEVFHAMPVQSDYSRFKRRGVPGFNIAFVDGLAIYHTALDDPAHLDLGSVQHMGYYAVNLARHLANQPLDNTHGESQVYFNTFGYHLVRYPASWVLPLCLACVACLAIVLGIGVRRGYLAAGRVTLGAAAFLACLALVAGIAALVAVVGYRWRGIYILYSSDPLSLGCLATTTLATAICLRWLSARLGVYNAVAGVLCVWMALLIAVSFLIPGASYLPLWPLAGATLGMGAMVCSRAAAQGRHRRLASAEENTGETPVAPAAESSRIALVAATLGAAVGLLLWPGMLYGLHTCLMIIFAAIPCAGAAMLLGLLTVPIAALSPRVARVAYVALAAVAILGFAWGVSWPGFSAAQPQFTSLAYALDADTHRGWWLSSDSEPNAWTRQCLSKDTTRRRADDFFSIRDKHALPRSGEYLRAPAPALELLPPRLEKLSDVTESGKRRLTLRVDSPRGAPILSLYAAPETRVLGGTIEGMALLPVEGRWFLHYGILPKAGVTLVLELDADAPVRLRAVDQSYGFPDGLVQPRPAWLGPKPNTPDFNRDPLKSDETLVAKSYEF